MVTQPLSVASQVLSRDTLQSVLRAPVGLVGWKILDRWAFNSPQQLRDLECQGVLMLLTRLVEQQRLEVHALADALIDGYSHLADHEILEMAGVRVEL